MTIKIERKVHAGGINKKRGKPYSNMEEKLQDYFKFWDNRVPVLINDPSTKKSSFENTREEKYNFMYMNFGDIIGFATSFDDQYIYMDKIDFLGSRDIDFDNCVANIASFTMDKDKNKDTLDVYAVIKIILEDRE